jgi:dipeptidyl aminopeptidase/acylaminoacyl peptidase
LIRRTDDVQQVLVVDVAAKQTRVIQTVKQSSKFDLDWVRRKGDDRLVMAATAELVQQGRAATGQIVKQEDKTYRISRVFAIGADGRNAVQIFQGQLSTLAGNLGSTILLDDLPGEPGHVMISAIENSGFGAWKADVMTGKAVQVANGSSQTTDYTTDCVGYPVIRVDETANVQHIFRRASGTEEWVAAGEIRQSLAFDTPDFSVVGPGPARNQVYVLARHDGLDRALLYLYDASTGDFGAPPVKGAEADVGLPWIDPKTRALVATCEFAARLSCKSIDPKLQKYLNALDQYFDKQASVELVNMSADAVRRLLRVDMPTEGAGYYGFDKATTQMEKVVDIYPGVPVASLSPTEVVSYGARDGAKLWTYVTAKAGADTPRPMVVLRHGGPESRDRYGYDAFAQFVAAQGYVVVQPHFHGSSGYGEAFATAGRGQWGQRMQDDVSDAVKHMIAASVADPARVCIVGASYGGYAALAGVMLTPELYTCAVSISGVSDLEEMLKSERHDSGGESNVFNYWRDSIGDPDKHRVALEAASPDRLTKKVTAPVLLIHGDDDKTVPVRQSALMHAALKGAGKSSKLVRLPKADHYWANWEKKDRLTLYQETAAVLKQYLN